MGNDGDLVGVAAETRFSPCESLPLGGSGFHLPDSLSSRHAADLIYFRTSRRRRSFTVTACLTVLWILPADADWTETIPTFRAKVEITRNHVGSESS